jgi:hypothetical protein
VNPLTDYVCNEVIRELRLLDIEGPLTHQTIRLTYKKLGLIVTPLGQYALFAFAEHFRNHPTDPVSLLGDVVRDEA